VKEPKERKRKTTAADAAADANGTATPAPRASRPRKRSKSKSEAETVAASTVEPRADRAPHSELEVAEEQIRTRAYLRYLERGATHGRALEDWLHAEEEHHRQAQDAQRR
jgi:hypothetical protein